MFTQRGTAMLTSEQIESYFESGYLLVEDVVTPEQLTHAG